MLQGMLDHNQVRQRIQYCKGKTFHLLKVRGKPILLLVNKCDIESAQDEVEVVSQLDIEALVNSAQCPTRVESSVATK